MVQSCDLRWSSASPPAQPVHPIVRLSVTYTSFSMGGTGFIREGLGAIVFTASHVVTKGARRPHEVRAHGWAGEGWTLPARRAAWGDHASPDLGAVRLSAATHGSDPGLGLGVMAEGEELDCRLWGYANRYEPLAQDFTTVAFQARRRGGWLVLRGGKAHKGLSGSPIVAPRPSGQGWLVVGVYHGTASVDGRVEHVAAITDDALEQALVTAL